MRAGDACVELFEFRDQDAATAGVPDAVGGFKHLALQADDVDGSGVRPKCGRLSRDERKNVVQGGGRDLEIGVGAYVLAR